MGGYFQQDGATCHTSNACMREIANYFGDRLMSKNLWPPRSPDLTPPDFFLWGLLTSRVYSNKPRTTDALKDTIRREIAAIADITLPHVFANFSIRSRQTLFCNIEDTYMSIFIGNITKIKKVLRNGTKLQNLKNNRQYNWPTSTEVGLILPTFIHSFTNCSTALCWALASSSVS
jgi:hypothetical protein